VSIQDAAAREAVLKALADRIGEELKKVRAEVQAELDANRGLQQVAALLPDGRKVAKISLTDPDPAAVVVDPEAFLAWARDHHPAGEANIVRRFVTEVRPAFTTALLAELTAVGAPEWCDRETGVVHAVPGVEIRATRARSHSVRFEKTGRELVAEAWASGQLTGLVLPQITAAPADPAN
jgi:phage tail protein X